MYNGFDTFTRRINLKESFAVKLSELFKLYPHPFSKKMISRQKIFLTLVQSALKTVSTFQYKQIYVKYILFVEYELVG